MEVPLSWIDYEATPIHFANQFVVQFQPDEFVLAIGQATAPAILGSPEEQAAQMAELTYIPVRTLGRFGLTRPRLQELIAALQANLDNHDRVRAHYDPTNPG